MSDKKSKSLFRFHPNFNFKYAPKKTTSEKTGEAQYQEGSSSNKSNAGKSKSSDK